MTTAAAIAVLLLSSSCVLAQVTDVAPEVTNAMPQDHCGDDAKAKCGTGTICIPTNTSYYCRCDPDNMKKCQLRPDYRLLNPDVNACCSHISSEGAWMIEVYTAADGKVAAIEHVACIHTMKSVPYRTDNSIPLDTRSQEVQDIQLTLASFYRSKQHDEAVQFSIQVNGCYREVLFGDTTSTKKPEQPTMLYFAAEKGSMFWDGDVCKVIPSSVGKGNISLDSLNNTLPKVTSNSTVTLKDECRSSSARIEITNNLVLGAIMLCLILIMKN
ncbi:hypothetical protein ElyMa_005790900 [Elysia marginata]|uniref:EGF-like domain-containing protein n=1 Tax=Elysia marginata TaxID=1093978 RepID=A0AAV4FTK2_9GAST|nr:hypothetical protein ElyMa_005790900 [Elysia marginata]